MGGAAVRLLAAADHALERAGVLPRLADAPTEGPEPPTDPGAAARAKEVRIPDVPLYAWRES